MAVYITLFKFEKVNNSTKRPNMDDGTRFECRINMPCTVTRPNVALTFDDNSIYPDYNYCYIDQFHRYYFISEWTYANGIWFADCRVDTLASWWDDLKDTTQYVTRNATVYDTYCQDLLYPTTTKQQIVNTPFFDRAPFENILSNGYYICGIVGNGNGQMGSMTYYRFTPQQFEQLGQFLFGNADWCYSENAFTTIELFKASFNPIQYIQKCFWLPIDVPVKKAVSSINIGWWNIGLTASPLSGATVLINTSVTVPVHPQYSRGKYMNAAPFSRYTLVFKPYGELPIDASYIAHEATIDMEVKVDPFTGDSVLTLKNGAGNNYYVARANLAVPIQITQSTTNIGGGITSLISGIASTMSNNFVGTLSAIGNAVDSFMPQTKTTGNNGSLAEYKETPYLVSQFIYAVDDDPAHRGKPLCMDKQLSSLSGFTKVSDAEISLPATDKEREQIKLLMEGGFYIE